MRLLALLLLASLSGPGCRGDGDGELPDDPPAGAEGLSAERKAAIRRFWEVYRRAVDLRLKGDADGAVAAYEEALELDPDHEDALYNLGNAAFDSGQYSVAEDAWRRLLRVNPHRARARAQLGALYYCGLPGAPFDLARARAELTRAFDLNREESGPLAKLGEVALLGGDLDEAARHFSLSQRANFRSVEAVYLEGYLKWRSGDAAAGKRNLARAVELSLAARGSASPGASSEGDTKRGSRPLLEGGARYITPLSSRWESLARWSLEEVTEARAQVEYQALDDVLQDFWQQTPVPSANAVE